ncbi:MAG: hypothetical protein HC817_10355 [Saprospiraceae bacterium]|nr:hypothetical protein [Saprospiraceae bacterium]
MRKNLRWVVLGLLLLFVASTLLPILTDTAGCAPSTPANSVVEQNRCHKSKSRNSMQIPPIP